MQYVNGHDISNYSINVVLDLAFSRKIPWTHLKSESSDVHSIYSYTSKEKGIFLDKGVCEFNISPENMFDLLYNVKLRRNWDMYCNEIETVERYDHLNHIIKMKVINPLGIFPMNIFRSCKYDPHDRIYVIAMRSIGLDDIDDSLDFLPNGWVIEGVKGYKDKCTLTFVQQCHLKDLENQEIYRYKSFSKIISLDDFHYLSIFPSTVSGRLGKIFECISNYITLNLKSIQIKDVRLSIIAQAEKEVNEMFGIGPEYGWTRTIKKYDMEILHKRTPESYLLLGKGSFSSTYSPYQIADLFSDKPWAWDTFFDNGTIVENIDEHYREVMLFYRMWHKSCQSRVVQSCKKGPGNCSSTVWISVSEPTGDGLNSPNNISIDFTFKPSGLFNYGLQQGTYTSFLVSLEIRGAKSQNEEDLFTKLFAARIISTQNNIVREMAMRINNQPPLDLKELPIIPTIQTHCDNNGFDIGVGGIPNHFGYMVELFANIVLSNTEDDDDDDESIQNDGQQTPQHLTSQMTQPQIIQPLQQQSPNIANTPNGNGSNNSTKNKRKRDDDYIEYSDENENIVHQNNINSTLDSQVSSSNSPKPIRPILLDSKEQQQLSIVEKQIKEQSQQQTTLMEKQKQSQEYLHTELIQKKLRSQKQNNVRLTIKMTNNITTSKKYKSSFSTTQDLDDLSDGANIIDQDQSMEDISNINPMQWTKKQPFLFLMSENEGSGIIPNPIIPNGANKPQPQQQPDFDALFSRRRLSRKEYCISNSDFDRVPEEIVQVILSFLSASDILTVGLVCKRFKLSTDSSSLWKYLYETNPLFKKSNPKKLTVAQTLIIQKQKQMEGNPLYKVLTHLAFSNINLPELSMVMENEQIKSMLPDDFDLAQISQEYLNDMNHDIQQKAVNFVASQNNKPETINNIINQHNNKTSQQSDSNNSTPPNDETNTPNNTPPNSTINNQIDAMLVDKECKICGCEECVCQVNLINWKSQYMDKLKLEERWNQCRPKKMLEFIGHSKPIKSIKCQGRTAVSFAQNNKTVKVWNVNSGQSIATYEDTHSSVVSIDYDLSKRCSYIWPLSEFTRIRVGHKNGTVSHYDFTENQEIGLISSHRTVLLADGFEFTLPNKYITWENMKVELWCEQTLTKLWTETRHTKKINDCKILQSTIAYGGLVCTTSSDKTAIVSDLETGNVLSTLTGHTKPVNCIEQIGDTLVMTASSDKTIKFWDFRNTSSAICSYQSQNPIKCMTYEEKGGRVLTGDDHGSVKCWNLNNWISSNQTNLNVNNYSKNILIGEIKINSMVNGVLNNIGITSIHSNDSGFVCGLNNGNIRRYDF